MSFFEDASLVLIPSAIKDQKVYSVKPTDGTGDLTFSRASSATRVASNGLIEKVRENLILQSNTFSDVAWVNTSSAETSGQAGYDGTNNAWLLEKFVATGRIVQNVTQSGLFSFSVYAKKGTLNGMRILVDGASVDGDVYFNLDNGTIGNNVSSAYASIESVGNGWYRCSVAQIDSAISNVRIYPSDASSLSTATGTIYIQDAQLEAGDIATDYIATTTAAVSVGPVSGLPRLDYLNSTCPRLLLEPQRTNLALYSEQLDNAYWGKNNLTITANTSATLDPAGLNGSDKVVETATTNFHQFERAFGTLSGSHSLSVFAKAAERNWVYLEFFTGAVGYATFFNLSTGAIGTTAAGNNAKIENYGNGWYRLSISRAAGSGTSFFVAGIASADNTASYAGNGTSGAYFWGAQLEAGAYATSYIPTLGTSVTRVGSAVYKGSISSLIGATEGVLFIDFIKPPTASTRTKIARTAALLTDGGNSFVRSINLDLETNGNLRANIVNTTSQVDIQTGAYSAGTRIKLAFAYKENDCVLYINGTQIGTDTSCTIPVCTAYEIGSYETANNTQTNYVSQALIFKTRLSNSDLAALTA